MFIHQAALPIANSSKEPLISVLVKLYRLNFGFGLATAYLLHTKKVLRF